MTPTQIETSARNRYNATGDTFYSSSEILDLMYQACTDLTRENNLIEGLYSTSTVIGQQGYDYPQTAISIRRITYEGQKLIPITMREDDRVTGLNQDTTDSGSPIYYFIWNKSIYLRPTPSAVGTLQIYTFNEPQVITATSTLEIPTHFHMDLVNFIVMNMAMKNSDLNTANYYSLKWEQVKLSAKKWARQNKRGDTFTHVQDEDRPFNYYMGIE